MRTIARRAATAAFAAGLLALASVTTGAAGFGERRADLVLVVPDAPEPGEPVTVVLVPGAPETEPPAYTVALLDADGRRLGAAPLVPFAETPAGDRVYAALIAVPNTAAAGSATLRIEGQPRGNLERPLAIGARSFLAEEIPLGPENTALRTEPDPRKEAEARELWRLLGLENRDFYASGTFMLPVDSRRRTSQYADRRTYRYTDQRTEGSIHAGIDFGVPRGTVVAACAAGRVVLARDRVVTGFSAVIEHLPGVFSLYYHLDALAVSSGDLVQAGTPIGRSGSSGLSTGPHLHWEIRVHGEAADPDAFVRRPVLDKDLILRTIAEHTDRSAEGR